jgi:hypothetical protein
MDKKKLVDWCWDAWCIFSIIGIWPRFIEPKLISTTKINLSLPNLPKSLEGLTVLQLSDLHWHGQFSSHFSRKLVRKINRMQPDLIVFTGDFLIRSQLENPDGLVRLLSSLKAKIGCFAILGNHDYDQYVTVNSDGDYDVELQHADNLHKGFKRLFKTKKVSGKISKRAQESGMHSGLIGLLKKTPFQLLHNATKIVQYKENGINVCGLGEYSLGRCLPEQAFKNYQPEFPGIVLAHNPDSIPNLLEYPGELILSGHTHGGQINLPVFRKKFTQLEQMHFMRGLKKLGNKWIYINRGLGAVMPFRWFSAPELTLFTLQKG